MKTLLLRNKSHLIAIFGGLIVGLLVGFCSSKGIYDKPIEAKIERDTLVVHDTIPDYLPTPKDSATIKYITKWFPMYKDKTDTITNTEYITMHDSVLVQVPIMQKHYGNETYDAWVSGFEPKMDSIKVYQKTEYITERITLIKPPNKWELDVVGGIYYNTAQKTYTPYALGELMYKPNRLQVGIQGGVVRNCDKTEPIVGGNIKIRVF